MIMNSDVRLISKCDCDLGICPWNRFLKFHKISSILNNLGICWITLSMFLVGHEWGWSINVAQSVTCLARNASLNADPGVAS